MSLCTGEHLTVNFHSATLRAAGHSLASLPAVLGLQLDKAEHCVQCTI